MVPAHTDTCMSHARRSRDGRTAGDHAIGVEDRTLTAKVVLMELARAGGPISAAALAERTLLSEAAVEAALEDLEATDLCEVRPGDDRRPRRFEADLSAADV